MLRLPSGFRDLAPPLSYLYEEVMDTIRRYFRIYGFQPLYTPHLELWEVLKGKYGEEAEKLLIWRFQDVWSNEWYALRYDHTVPLVRHFISRQYSLPFKRYTIGSVFRHERPQKGRFREFIQADADIIGTAYPEADAELLNMIVDVMSSLGFENKFHIKLNDRRIIEGILREQFKTKDPLRVFRVIDKLDKIGEAGVSMELAQLMGENSARKLLSMLLELKGEPGKVIPLLSERIGQISRAREGLLFLEEMIEYIDPSKKKYITFSLDLVRGLDYYTGPIWEIIIPEAKLGSVGGGGRYDELVGLYKNEKIPATGTSFGVDRIVEAKIELDLISGARKIPLVCIITIKREIFKHAWNLANRLRAEGIPVIIDLLRRKLSKQKEYAKKVGAKILVFVGDKEIQSGRFVVIVGNDRYEVENEKLIGFIKKMLNGRECE